DVLHVRGADPPHDVPVRLELLEDPTLDLRRDDALRARHLQDREAPVLRGERVDLPLAAGSSGAADDPLLAAFRGEDLDLALRFEHGRRTRILDSGAMRTHTALDRRGERAAAFAAERRGARVLACNWRGGGGELDLIIDDGGAIVFCEVKTRAS